MWLKVNRLNHDGGNFRNVAGPVFVVTVGTAMVKFLLWCILLVLCWPLALAALVLYPVVWLLLIPFRIVGIAVEGALGLVWAIVTLPFRVVKAIA